MPGTLRHIARVLKSPTFLGVPSSDLAALDEVTASLLLSLTFFRTDATGAEMGVVKVTLDSAVHIRNMAIYLDATYTKAYLRRAQANFEVGTTASLEKSIHDYEQVRQMLGRGNVTRDIENQA